MKTNFHISFNNPASTKLGTFNTKMLAEICNRNSFLVVLYLRLYARHVNIYIYIYIYMTS